jgi:hypothetical protein
MSGNAATSSINIMVENSGHDSNSTLSFDFPGRVAGGEA